MMTFKCFFQQLFKIIEKNYFRLSRQHIAPVSRDQIIDNAPLEEVLKSHLLSLHDSSPSSQLMICDICACVLSPLCLNIIRLLALRADDCDGQLGSFYPRVKGRML